MQGLVDAEATGRLQTQCKKENALAFPRTVGKQQGRNKFWSGWAMSVPDPSRLALAHPFRRRAICSDAKSIAQASILGYGAEDFDKYRV